MASLNKCMFIGNLTRDPEIKYMPSGEAVANCSIACNKKFKDKDGKLKESVEFVNIVFFKGIAETAAKHLKKGSKVYIEGYLKTEKYQDKATGADRYSTKIIAQTMQFLDSKDSRSTDDLPDEIDDGTRDRLNAAMKAKPKADKFEDFDDDIPF